MSAPITCPVCTHEGAPAAQIDRVAICAVCGSSLVVEGDTVRQATGADTTGLPLEDLQTLRKARGRTR